MKYDVIVIGAGPAGYVAAIRCAQLGLKIACIDQWLNEKGQARLGGTCLNAGCIPSKALLESSELYYRAQHEFINHGLKINKLGLDLKTMQSHKDGIVQQLTDGISSLFQVNKIEWLQGSAQLLEGLRVAFTAHGKKKAGILQATNIIIASGSRPVEIAAAPLDNQHIVDSSGALAFKKVPKRLGIIGAGVIGLELGSVWKRLGSEVTILEAQEQFLPSVDQKIAKLALREYRKQGLDIQLGARVTSSKRLSRSVKIQYEQGGDNKQLTVDQLVVAVGRRPNSETIAAAEANLLLDERGFINVDEYCATNIPNVYAIGDVVRGPMLAHKGSEEGVIVAESIASGKRKKVNLDIIPSVIYTHPELSSVGKTEEELKEAGVAYRSGSFPFAANGRARAMDAPEGLVKLLADRDTDQLLGVHIFGAGASELIAEATLALEFCASSEDLARTIHAHPTLSESIHEAALGVTGHAIHQAR
ncbi:MAG: dihydrolipoyl dehydrogenase [Gammaproteobacteria bacterium]|nr:dihydrolipoyl dehydrogenase [Gammaproteobacteria bacterium]